eukprot:g32643.t2
MIRGNAFSSGFQSYKQFASRPKPKDEGDPTRRSTKVQDFETQRQRFFGRSPKAFGVELATRSEKEAWQENVKTMPRRADSEGALLRYAQSRVEDMTRSGLREEKRRLPLQHRAHRRTARCGARSGARLAMVIKTDLCSYTEYRIYPGHGQKFVAKDAKVSFFINAKADSLFHQRIKPVKLRWTQAWRRMNKKGKVEEGGKKKARKAQKFQKAIAMSSAGRSHRHVWHAVSIRFPEDLAGAPIPTEPQCIEPGTTQRFIAQDQTKKAQRPELRAQREKEAKEAKAKAVAKKPSKPAVPKTKAEKGPKMPKGGGGGGSAAKNFKGKK